MEKIKGRFWLVVCCMVIGIPVLSIAAKANEHIQAWGYGKWAVYGVVAFLGYCWFYDFVEAKVLRKHGLN